MHFSGQGAEWDGRGFFAGRERRTRLGLGPFQMLRMDQDYDLGAENYFKKVDSLWTARMNSRTMRWSQRPAKELEYDYWADDMHMGAPIMHRGWQYWENIGIEAGICEPFLTHVGLNLRLGIDPSEISDWLLGYCTVDFKKDDLTIEEYIESRQGRAASSVATSPKPASN